MSPASTAQRANNSRVKIRSDPPYILVGTCPRGNRAAEAYQAEKAINTLVRTDAPATKYREVIAKAIEEYEDHLIKIHPDIPPDLRHERILKAAERWVGTAQKDTRAHHPGVVGNRLVEAYVRARGELSRRSATYCSAIKSKLSR